MRMRIKKSNFPLLDFLKERLSRHKFYKPAIVLLLVSYLLSFLIIVISTQRGTLFARPPAPELGKVATEDITVDRDIFYVDAKATTLKREARIKLVSPVFLLNKAIAKESMASFIRFRDIFIRNLKEKNSVVKNTVDTLLTRIQYEFPMIIGKMRREEFALLSYKKYGGNLYLRSRSPGEGNVRGYSQFPRHKGAESRALHIRESGDLEGRRPREGRDPT